MACRRSLVFFCPGGGGGSSINRVTTRAKRVCFLKIAYSRGHSPPVTSLRDRVGKMVLVAGLGCSRSEFGTLTSGQGGRT